eukprot:2725218-Pleurochrysis_carterae.AAC.1
MRGAAISQAPLLIQHRLGSTADAGACGRQHQRLAGALEAARALHHERGVRLGLRGRAPCVSQTPCRNDEVGIAVVYARERLLLMATLWEKHRGNQLSIQRHRPDLATENYNSFKKRQRDASSPHNSNSRQREV